MNVYLLLQSAHVATLFTLNRHRAASELDWKQGSLTSTHKTEADRGQYPTYQNTAIPIARGPRASSGKTKISRASCEALEPPEASRALSIGSRALRSIAELPSTPINRRSSFPLLNLTPRLSPECSVKHVAGCPPVGMFSSTSVGRSSANQNPKSSQTCPEPFTWSHQLPARRTPIVNSLFPSPLTLFPSARFPLPSILISITSA